MKFYIHTAALFAATISISGAALPLPIPDLVTKEWHSSPPIAITSKIFGVIEWDKMPMIKIGITEQALRGISPTLSPFKNASVLIYSMNPVGICYEIELLINSGHVSDISYKVSENESMHRRLSVKYKLTQPHK